VDSVKLFTSLTKIHTGIVREQIKLLNSYCPSSTDFLIYKNNNKMDINTSMYMV
jgi:hypothetical protein